MSVSSPPKALKIFSCYATNSPEDKVLFDLFSNHVSLLQHRYPYYEWYDSEISAGSPVNQFIEAHLNTADLILLFTSAAFFASERCFELATKRAIARSNAGETRLIPVRLRPTDWEASPLNRYRSLPSNDKPISLWPDPDAAFTDVIEGIREVLEDLASQESKHPFVTSPSVSVCDPPYTYDDLFTDREPLLEEITRSFASTRPRRTPILALSGMGGIGKTSIALEYCYQATKTYRAILWLNASSRTVIRTYVTPLANWLSLPREVRDDEQQLFPVIKQWLRNLPDWLLVLDQIEDLTLVDLIVPPLSSGHVLLTTRTQNPRKRATMMLSIPSMDVDSGAIFLLRRMQILSAQASLDQAPADAAREARAVAHALDGFPLALDQAGAYLEQRGGDLSTYLSLYQKQRAQLLNEPGQPTDDHGESLASVLLRSLELLKETSHRDLFYLLAFLHPDGIPEGLLINGAPALEEPLRSLATNFLVFHQALGELRRSSLIRYHANKAVFQIQRMAQDVIIDRMTLTQRQHWARQAILLVNHAFPQVRFDTRALCERYLPQAEHCATLMTHFHLTFKEGALLLERLGSFCYRRASYIEAETYLTQALHCYERSLPGDILDTAQTLNSLGLLFRRRARYKKAEELHQRALELREQMLGPDDPKTAESLHNLALISGDLGKYQEAERLYLRVLAVEERTKGSGDPNVADTLNNLGLTYAQQGRSTEAEKAYRRALTIYKRSLAPDHPDLAYPLSGLGALAEKRGRDRQAEKLYQQALALRQQAFGEVHPEIARSIVKLAGIAELRSDYQQAEILYQQALTMSEQILGQKHPDVALILNNQALLATKQGQHLKAEPLYQRALSIYKQVLGPEHPAVASVLNNLGQLARIRGKLERAEKLLRRALAIREKAFGATHPSLAQSWGNLANVLTDQQRYEEAESFFQRAFALYLQMPAPRHPDVEQIPEKYASMLEHLSRNQEARELRKAVRRPGRSLSAESSERDDR